MNGGSLSLPQLPLSPASPLPIDGNIPIGAFDGPQRHNGHAYSVTPEQCIQHVVSALDVPEPEKAPLTQTREPFLQRLELLDQDLSIPLHNWDPGYGSEFALLLPASLFQPFSVPMLLLAAFFLSHSRFFIEVLAGT